MAAHAGTVLNVAGSSEKAGMISCAKRPRLSREPPQLIITYRNHAATGGSVVIILSFPFALVAMDFLLLPIQKIP
jgi:uncharacterized protein YceK